METESHDKLDVTTFVCQRPNIASTNKISMSIRQLIKDFNQDDSWMQTEQVGSSRFSVKPNRFTPQHLSALFRARRVHSPDDLGQIIARDIKQKLASDNSLWGPVLVIVCVDFIIERRLVFPPDDVLAAPSRSASWEVFERLVREQRVELKDLEGDSETQCSICIEDLSKSTHENIIEMPRCLHWFHQDCLFEWLVRQNSCPLCRRVPYEEDQETET